MELTKHARDLTGERFGSLVGVRPLYKAYRNNIVWEFICDCGNTHEVVGNSVIANAKKSNDPRSPSCGCMHKINASQIHTKHGYSTHPLMEVWRGMVRRCHDPKYSCYDQYGAKGIVVCDEWLNDPIVFITWAIKNNWKQGMHIDKDMGSDAQSITRVYSPDTCRVLPGNINQSYSASRSNYAHSPRIKITPQNVLEIRALHALNGLSYNDLANKYNVSKSTIGRVLKQN